MKHAILILAHKNLDHLCSLVEYFDKCCDIFIHLDRKQKYRKELLDKIYSYRQVVYISHEYEVNWGGTSVLKSEIALIDKAYSTSHYDYFHLISGQDYPVRPLSFFLTYFEKYNGKEFLQYIHLPHQRWENSTYFRFQYYFPYDFASDKKKTRRWVSKMVHRQQSNGVKRSIPDEFNHLYGSSQWFSLTNKAIGLILSYTMKYPAFFKRLSMTFAPEECYVATVLLNQINHDNIVNSNLRFILWKYENGNRPANLDENHFSLLLERDYFFARKMEYPCSQKLKDLIDNHLIRDNEVQLSPTGGWIYNGYNKYKFDNDFFNFVGRLCFDISIKSALDIGCGAGMYVSKWRRMGLPFAGYDANPFTRELSERLLPKGDIPCGVADITEDIIVNGQFDIVICKDVLPYIPDNLQGKAIKQLSSLSKHMIILSWNHNESQTGIQYQHIDEDNTTLLFKKMGFIIENYLTMKMRYALRTESCCVMIKKGHQIIN